MWGIVRFVGRFMDRRHRRDAYIRETRSTDGQWEGSLGDGVHRVEDGDALVVTRTIEGDPPRDVEVSTDGGGCDECGRETDLAAYADGQYCPVCIDAFEDSDADAEHGGESA